MKVGVTGGCGFIGSHVVDKLKDARVEVRVLDSAPRPHRDDVECVAVDILDQEALDRATRGLDVIFHLAAYADVNNVVADPTGAVALNVLGTSRVLESARRNELRRVVLASTVWVYGAAREPRVDERSCFDPAATGHVYTTTKIASEMLCHDYKTLFGVPFTILRYGIPYGPRMRPSLVIPIFIRKALGGEPMTVAGDGSQNRKFVYVEDLADAHVLALAPEAEGQTYNIDGAEEVSILRIAETVHRLVGGKGIEFVPARAGDYGGKQVSSAKAAREIGWTPKVDFETGMERTVQWYLEQERTALRTA
ncbi:MAG: NAD-dependent epimerase/dehydratase family protein [Dehalococcoidia bacterium]|nr:NAD-dependent epimerase/dehydratase family protein [Dehalococcoidia bacterium]